MDDSYEVWWNSNHALLRRTQKFDLPLIFPPPPPPLGATMDTAKNCFYSSPMYNSFGKHYLTVLLLELEKRNLYSYGPSGPPYHLDNLAFPTTRDDFCHIWLKFAYGFWRNRWNKYFFSMPAPQGCASSQTTKPKMPCLATFTTFTVFKPGRVRQEIIKQPGKGIN